MEGTSLISWWNGIALAALLSVAACAGRPSGDVSVGPGGIGAGASSGPVRARVGPGGPSARVDVVAEQDVNVSVGTGGPRANMRLGDSPFRLGIGLGGVGLGF